MSFIKYFAEQLQIHPSMRYADAVKLCYQAAFGAEHLLSDKTRARAYLYAELEATPPTDEPLFERISEELCRVNLGAWRREGLPFEELFEAFVASASQRENGAETLASNLAAAESVMKENMKGFSASEWQQRREQELLHGGGAHADRRRGASASLRRRGRRGQPHVHRLRGAVR